MALTAVLFAHPVRQLLFILPDDLDAVVSASAVDDDLFQVWIVLLQNGANGLFQVFSLVERWSNYRNF